MAFLECRQDPLVKLLNDRGYMPVKLPRTGVVPPHVYVDPGDERLVALGPLAKFVAGGHLPAQPNSGKAADISQQATARMDTKAAGSLLQQALQAIGVTDAPKLDLSFLIQHRVQFTFSDVTWIGVDPVDISNALYHANFSSQPCDQVKGDMLLIAYEFIYARKLMMGLVAGHAGGIDFAALKLEHFLELGAKAKVEATSSTMLSFSASGEESPVAFGFKSGRVRHDRGRFAFDVTRLSLAPGAPPVPEPHIRGAVIVVEEAG